MKFRTLALALLAAAAFTSEVSALDRSMVVKNRTGYAIMQMFGSNRDEPGWQEDLLGDGWLDHGESISVDWNDGSGYCKFDFKVVLDNGQVLTKYNVNVCTVGTFTWR